MATLMSKPINILKSSKAKYLIRPRDRAYFLLTLADLAQQGFSMNQSLEFMEVLLPRYSANFQFIRQQLLKGLPFETSLKEMGYSSSLIAQIFFAEKQGRFVQGLYDASRQIQQIQKDRETIIKVLTYPLFLLVCIVIMLFGVRSFILPQMLSFISESTYQESLLVRILVNFFRYLPQILTGIGILLIFSYCGINYYLLRMPLLQRYQKCVKVPLFGRWLRYYCSYKLTYQFAFFFEAGFSMQQIIHFLRQYPLDAFLTEMAVRLAAGFESGHHLEDQLKQVNIFTAELPLVIRRGTMISALSHQCRIYSERLYQELIKDIRRKISYIQPLLFSWIALLIISMYLLMMLPLLTMQTF
ncbi:competence type IV pilus assembly protein ComGB [Ignavigranum ruoffiae]|uniref:competence type IV pilus assembly protein ComGB n=1 Tax=Ignavigranum ruoffiae TaxID=89093 RepID=UPI0024ADBC2C|nr:competence type IV pilus assembly protein ComGB [Ignavigranum ruoffiae]